MKKFRRLHTLLIISFVFFLTLACNVGSEWGFAPPTSVLVGYNPGYPIYSGQVTGSSETIYHAQDKIYADCPEATGGDYHLELSNVWTPPSDTQITGSFPSDQLYFRLVAGVVQRIHNEGVCLERDPSQDRVQMIIEGSFNPETNIFTVLSCGKLYELGEGKIYYESEKRETVGADITCNLSDQIKVVLKFSGMALHAK